MSLGIINDLSSKYYKIKEIYKKNNLYKQNEMLSSFESSMKDLIFDN